MFRFGIPIALFWLAVDQSSKWWILNRVMDTPKVVPVTGFFNIVLGWNTGVSFGLLDQTSTAMLIAVSSMIVIFLVAWMWRSHTVSESAGLGLIIGGAVGNVVDRVRHGAVTDFLDFYFREWHWPAFNLADVGIVAGTGILLISSALSTDKNAVRNGQERSKVRTTKGTGQ